MKVGTTCKQKTLLLALFALMGTALIVPQAKADSWSQIYIVDQATHSTLYDPYVIEDSRGHKWVQIYGANRVGSTTYAGVFEYDGQSWTNHTNSIQAIIGGQHLVDNGTIFADTQGNIWQNAVTAESGYYLLQYDGSNWHKIEATDIWAQVLGTPITGYENDTTFDMFGDNQGNIYIISWINCDQANRTDSIRILKRDTSGNWSTAVPSGGILNETDVLNNMHAKFNSTTGDVWLYFKAYFGQAAPEKGVYRYHNGTWTNYTTADGLISNTVQDILVDFSGNVWVTSSNGVSKFDGSSWSAWNTGNSNLTNNDIRQISEDSKGRIWFMTASGASAMADSGISVYDPADNSWIYFTDKSGDNNLNNVSKTFHFGNDAWISTGDWSQGFIIYNLNDTQTTIYGQTSGDVVSKAGFDMAKKKKKVKTISNKSVTIYKITKVKKKKKYKTKKTLVYKTGATQWYKALNLDTGKYQVVSKAKGKKKKTRTINITSGDPYRLDLRY
jgi:hypothetical protein